MVLVTLAYVIFKRVFANFLSAKSRSFLSVQQRHGLNVSPPYIYVSHVYRKDNVPQATRSNLFKIFKEVRHRGK